MATRLTSSFALCAKSGVVLALVSCGGLRVAPLEARRADDASVDAGCSADAGESRGDHADAAAPVRDATREPLATATPGIVSDDLADVSWDVVKAPVQVGQRPKRLPGKCVGPEKELRDQWSSRWTMDLDDDGVADAVVEVGAYDITTINRVYVRRGECSHYVGTLEGPFRIFKSRRQTNGLHDLLGRRVMRAGPIFASSTVCVYRFDGTKYRLRNVIRLASMPPDPPLPPGEGCK